MTSKRTVVFALLSLLMLQSSAFAFRKVKSQMLTPPSQPLVGITRIAVLDFTGDGGRAAAEYIISDLVSVGGKFTKKDGSGATVPFYEVVERSRLEQIMKEQALGQSGIIDDNQAAQLGKVLGVDAIVSGDIVHEKKEGWYKNVWEDSDGNKHVEDCLKREVSAKMKWRVVSAQSAKILAAEDYSWAQADDKCGDATSKVRSVATMLDKCVKEMCSGFVLAISPHYVTEEIELAKVKNKEIADKANDAAKQAEDGEWDKAYAVYYGLFQADNYNPELLYNLGVLNHAAGNFAAAKEMYDNAVMLKPKEKDFTNAASRCEVLNQYPARLAQVGIEVAEHVWDTSESAVAQATADMVRTKGNDKLRHDVYEQPNNTSAVVAKVPGNIELQVISVESEWYKVKLMGGKEGYLHKTQLKL